MAILTSTPRNRCSLHNQYFVGWTIHDNCKPECKPECRMYGFLNVRISALPKSLLSSRHFLSTQSAKDRMGSPVGKFWDSKRTDVGLQGAALDSQLRWLFQSGVCPRRPPPPPWRLAQAQDPALQCNAVPMPHPFIRQCSFRYLCKTHKLSRSDIAIEGLRSLMVGLGRSALNPLPDKDWQWAG